MAINNRRDAKIRIGDRVRHHARQTIQATTVQFPDPTSLVHLQFRRYTGCPVCNLHLRSFSERHQEIVRAGVREIVVFHSSPESMEEFQGDLPFAAIADPGKELYREFGVERMAGWSAVRNALSPRSWRAAIRGLANAPSLQGAIGIGEDHMGLPADFLIRPDGVVQAVRYGAYVDDHWSVDEVLELVEAPELAEAPALVDAPGTECGVGSASV